MHKIRKHKLQWKLIGIMFISVVAGVSVMGLAEGAVFSKLLHMTAEEAEISFAKYSALFNLLFILVTILVFFLLSRKLIQRIEILCHNTEVIAQGKLDLYQKDKHHDELGILSLEMFQMAEHIQDSIQSEKNMICNMAHDLRTPVTSISGYIELLQQEDLSEQGQENLYIIARKSSELSQQINELLEYSILDFHNREYELEELSLSSLVEQVLIDFIPQLETAHFRYTLKGNTKPCLCHCNQGLCVRLLENLLVNAIRYGTLNRQIDIILNETTDFVQIDISNYGRQIPENELSHMFDAFYQGTEAKNYQTESKGLGLAIAKQIVSIHDGNIHVQNHPEENKITFSVLLPRCDKSNNTIVSQQAL